MDSLTYLILWISNIYYWTIFVYLIMSFFPRSRDTKFGLVLSDVCEPYLAPFRKVIPPLGMFDFSPIVALIVLRLATYGLVQLLNLIF